MTPAISRHPLLGSIHILRQQCAHLVDLNTKWSAVRCSQVVPEIYVWSWKLSFLFFYFHWHACYIHIAFQHFISLFSVPLPLLKVALTTSSVSIYIICISRASSSEEFDRVLRMPLEKRKINFIIISSQTPCTPDSLIPFSKECDAPRQAGEVYTR